MASNNLIVGVDRLDRLLPYLRLAEAGLVGCDRVEREGVLLLRPPPPLMMTDDDDDEDLDLDMADMAFFLSLTKQNMHTMNFRQRRRF